jgi:FO synthase
MMRIAGELAVPFTTGILIGIGETRAERLESLVAMRELHARHGHIQEVIVQNFRAKPDTKQAAAPEPDLDDLLWSIAAARLILPDDVHVQAPPNLSPGVYEQLINAGIDDWGGVSPVTPDHVIPGAMAGDRGPPAHRGDGQRVGAWLPVYPPAFERIAGARRHRHARAPRHRRGRVGAGGRLHRG